MADNNTLLILRLEGLLQSWGEWGKWDYRDSAILPTKSGLVGLLGCALGIEYGSSALTDLSNAITIAIRADRIGTKSIDFQTVHGAPMRAATGKPRNTGDTIITPREYIQDGCFTIFIETDESWRNRIIAALNEPKWSLYLGRKSCIPSRPIFEALSSAYISLKDAVMSYPMCERVQFPVIYELEIANHTGASVSRSDDLAGARQFFTRRVWRGVIEEDT